MTLSELAGLWVRAITSLRKRAHGVIMSRPFQMLCLFNDCISREVVYFQYQSHPWHLALLLGFSNCTCNMNCTCIIPTRHVQLLFSFRNKPAIIITAKEMWYFTVSTLQIVKLVYNQAKQEGKKLQIRCAYPFHVPKHKCLIYGLWVMLMLLKIAFPFRLIEVNELCNCSQFNVAFCLTCEYENILFLESTRHAWRVFKIEWTATSVWSVHEICIYSNELLTLSEVKRGPSHISR